MYNKLGCLYQCWKENYGTDKIEVIFCKYKPKDRMATYVRDVCNIQPQKIENKTRYKRESDRLFRSGQHTNIRLENNETPCKQRHLRHQIKINVHESILFLHEKPDGQGQIHRDPAFNNTTKICGRIQSLRKSTQ